MVAAKIFMPVKSNTELYKRRVFFNDASRHCLGARIGISLKEASTKCDRQVGL